MQQGSGTRFWNCTGFLTAPILRRSVSVVRKTHQNIRHTHSYESRVSFVAYRSVLCLLVRTLYADKADFSNGELYVTERSMTSIYSLKENQQRSRERQFGLKFHRMIPVLRQPETM